MENRKLPTDADTADTALALEGLTHHVGLRFGMGACIQVRRN